MADDDLEDDDDDVEDGEEGEGSPKKGGKKKLLIILVAVLVLVVGGAAGAYFAGLLDPVVKMIAGGGEEDVEEEAAPLATNVVFFDLPEFLVNLNTGGRKSTFLKIRVSLELERAEDVPRVEQMMPRIVDNFQVYLRELRVDDLKGSAGLYRLREELLSRVSAAVAPARVNDILFKEMLVQ